MIQLLATLTKIIEKRNELTYGMDGVEFGEKILYPVTSKVVNGRGEGDYVRGIRADFKATDDLNHQLGDPQEGMMKKALEILEKDAFKM